MIVKNGKIEIVFFCILGYENYIVIYNKMK